MERKAQTGYLILADISGYTSFVAQTEIEHADMALSFLLETIIEHLSNQLIISKLEGDGVFAYVEENQVGKPETLLQLIDQTYLAFRDKAMALHRGATCPCRACRNIHKLDLKMCIHYGEYLIQKLGDREELLGADVIVPHRMLKNHVIEQTGVKAYALFSEAATNALNLLELTQPLIPHTESYEHLGEVKMHVFDLAPVWKNAQEQKRNLVTKETAWISLEMDLPFPPTLVWEYLTKPDLEAGFLGYDYAERIDTLGGRVREDAGFHCAHGDLHIYSKVLDWKPFDYYTLKQSVPGISYICTRSLTPLETGTHLGVYLSKPPENSSDEVYRMLQSAMNHGYAGLQSYIQQDLLSGKISIS